MNGTRVRRHISVVLEDVQVRAGFVSADPT